MTKIKISEIYKNEKLVDELLEIGKDFKNPDFYEMTLKDYQEYCFKFGIRDPNGKLLTPFEMESNAVFNKLLEYGIIQSLDDDFEIINDMEN